MRALLLKFPKTFVQDCRTRVQSKKFYTHKEIVKQVISVIKISCEVELQLSGYIFMMIKRFSSFYFKAELGLFSKLSVMKKRTEIQRYRIKLDRLYMLSIHCALEPNNTFNFHPLSLLTHFALTKDSRSKPQLFKTRYGG